MSDHDNFDYYLQLKVKKFAHSEFSRTATQIQGISRAWNFLLSIPGLSRIFKDHGNPVFIYLPVQSTLQDLKIYGCPFYRGEGDSPQHLH